MRVQPDTVDLGATYTHETAFFAFAYHKLDAAAVASVAAEIDAIYTDLRRDYGLPPVADRLAVTLAADFPASRPRCYRRNHLCVPSPSLTPLPAGSTEAEVLNLWLVEALIYDVRWDAIETARFAYGWGPVLAALPRVQARRHSARLDAYYADLVGWLYGSVARALESDEAQPAQALEALCTRHQVMQWQLLVVGSIVASPCIDPDWVRAGFVNRPVTRLGDLHSPDGDQHSAWPVRVADERMRMLAAETLLDYVVATYGRDALPALVDGFRRYDGWSTLVPAVFNLSVEEFEAGWQDYLRTLE